MSSTTSDTVSGAEVSSTGSESAGSVVVEVFSSLAFSVDAVKVSLTPDLSADSIFSSTSKAGLPCSSVAVSAAVSSTISTTSDAVSGAEISSTGSESADSVVVEVFSSLAFSVDAVKVSSTPDVSADSIFSSASKVELPCSSAAVSIGVSSTTSDAVSGTEISSTGSESASSVVVEVFSSPTVLSGVFKVALALL